MDKQTIIKNFSRCANSYDRYADVQKLAGLELLEQIKEKNFSKILEIGCGIGNYTLLLREEFKQAELQTIDISEKMVEIASGKLKDKEIKFVIADAETVELEGDFDLVTSNVCFQWFNDLERALVRYRDVLRKNGVMAFTIYGPLTFWELNTCLKHFLDTVSVYAQTFIPKEKIEETLKTNFRDVRVKETRYKESFLHLENLLQEIKYTGVRGCNQRKGFFSPQFLRRLEGLYLDRFGQIRATHQVFFCSALK